MKITSTLGHFAHRAQFADLPDAVVGRSKQVLLDAIGCGIFGATLKHCRQVIAVVEALGGRPECTVLGTRMRTNGYMASLANGTQIHGLELDDVGVYNHPAGGIVPAIFAAIETVDHPTDGREVITAVSIAYEIATRIGEALGMEVESEIGWHTPGFYGSLGSAAAAARIFGLDETLTVNTLGIAGDLAGGGLMSARTTAADSKKMHSGRGAATGFLAALLSQKGFRGVEDVLEQDPWGFFWVLSGQRDSTPLWDGEVAIRDLGREYLFVDRVTFKYFPAIGHSQTVLETVKALKYENTIDVDDIAKVRIGMATFHWNSRVRREVNDLTSANFSPIYAAALALLHDLPPLYESSDTVRLWLSGIDDPSVHALMERIEETVDPEIQSDNPYSLDTTVEIEFKDGSKLSKTSAYERSGLPSIGTKRLRSMSLEELERKFHHLVDNIIGKSAADAICQQVNALESLTDFRPVVRLASLPQ